MSCPYSLTRIAGRLCRHPPIYTLMFRRDVTGRGARKHWPRTVQFHQTLWCRELLATAGAARSQRTKDNRFSVDRCQVLFSHIPSKKHRTR